jgi:hypothetical protein
VDQHLETIHATLSDTNRNKYDLFYVTKQMATRDSDRCCSLLCLAEVIADFSRPLDAITTSSTADAPSSDTLEIEPFIFLKYSYTHILHPQSIVPLREIRNFSHSQLLTLPTKSLERRRRVACLQLLCITPSKPSSRLKSIALSITRIIQRDAESCNSHEEAVICSPQTIS